jgi:hypothetical protein
VGLVFLFFCPDDLLYHADCFTRMNAFVCKIVLIWIITVCKSIMYFISYSLLRIHLDLLLFIGCPGVSFAFRV